MLYNSTEHYRIYYVPNIYLYLGDIRLLWAAKNGDAAKVKSLLAQGANVNFKNERG